MKISIKKPNSQGDSGTPLEIYHDGRRIDGTSISVPRGERVEFWEDRDSAFTIENRGDRFEPTGQSSPVGVERLITVRDDVTLVQWQPGYVQTKVK